MVSQVLGLPSREAPAGPPGQDPGHVGVHHGRFDLVGEGPDGPRCVGADTRESLQLGPFGRNLATVSSHHDSGCPVEVNGSPVVAKS